MRILLVAQDRALIRAIRQALADEHYDVDVADPGIATSGLTSYAPYDAIVVDRLLPDIDGEAIVRHLRRSDVSIPILMTAMGSSPEDRIGGLDAGADDYLPSPFAASELVARLHALTRRMLAPNPRAVVATGDLQLDEERHVLRVANHEVGLSAREFALMSYFIHNAGDVLSRRQILHAVWGGTRDSYSNVVDLYVHYLRVKLETVGRGEVLRTIRGVGYTLRV
jgi:DNA-binding response OmpR family regulator